MCALWEVLSKILEDWMKGKFKRYVVAVNQKEADDLASLIGWETRVQAGVHLAEVKAPPTDPYYANQYRVYTVLMEKT